MSTRIFLVITALTALAVVVCIRWIDYPLATLLSHYHHRVTNADIPNFLLPGCLLLVALAWATYRCCTVAGRWPSVARSARAIGIVTPVVFIVKEVVQHLFGRVFPRAILWHRDLAEFQFFHANLLRGGFPSGHMMIAASLLLVVGRYTRVPHWVLLAAGIALGVALIVTDYHFLSDVVAGAYGGYVVESTIHNWKSGSSTTKQRN
jgi:membrane-associated phospholipid phosphatase